MKKIVSLIIFLIFLASVLNMSYPIFRYFIIIFTILLFFIFNAKKVEYTNKNKLLLIFSLFVLSGLISSLVNSDKGSFINVMSLFFLYIALSFIFNGIVKHPLRVINKSVLNTHLLVLVVSFVLFGNDIPFKGVFINPNSMGQVITVLAVPIATLLYQLMYDALFLKYKFKKMKVLSLFILSIVAIYASILTGSRSSTFITLIIFLIPFIYILIRTLRRPKVLPRIIFAIPLLAFITWNLFRYTDIFVVFNEMILEKFISKSGDLTDGRSDVWSYAFNNATLFGNGHDFFNNTVGSHNTFIGILGEFGWFALIFFSLFVLQILINTFKYSLSSIYREYRFFPFLMTVVFILTSMTEGMLFKSPMIALFMISFIQLRFNNN